MKNGGNNSDPLEISPNQSKFFFGGGELASPVDFFIEIPILLFYDICTTVLLKRKAKVNEELLMNNNNSGPQLWLRCDRLQSQFNEACWSW